MTNLKPRLKEEVQVYQLRRNDLIYINSILYKIVDIRPVTPKTCRITIAEWENQKIHRYPVYNNGAIITRYRWQDKKKRKRYGNRR